MVDSAIALDTHKDASAGARGRTDTDRRGRGVMLRRIEGGHGEIAADEGAQPTRASRELRRLGSLRSRELSSLRVARLLIGDRLLQHGRIDLHAGLRQGTLQEHFAGAISADERDDLALAVQHELGGDAADAEEPA